MSLSPPVSGLHHRVVFRAGESADDAGSHQGGAAAEATASSAIDASGAKTPVNGLAALLGPMGSAKGGPASTADPSAATTAPQATQGAADAAAEAVLIPAQAKPSTAPRPNIDALNRVLAHYAAQSAAASLPFVIVDD